MKETTIIKSALLISLIGLLIIFLMESAPTDLRTKNITIDFCSRKDGNTYLFYSEEKENKAVFEGDFPCKINQRISISGKENGDWFQVHSIKVLE
jgi:hypothetical protein